jgi:hypothetical protein
MAVNWWISLIPRSVSDVCTCGSTHGDITCVSQPSLVQYGENTVHPVMISRSVGPHRPQRPAYVVCPTGTKSVESDRLYSAEEGQQHLAAGPEFVIHCIDLFTLS